MIQIVLALLLSLGSMYAAETGKETTADRYIVVQSALRTGMPEIALAELKKMSEQEGAYWLYYGRALRQLKRPGEAIGAFAKYLNTHPEQAAGFNGLGMAYSETGDTETGERYLQKATELAPMDPTYYHDLGKNRLIRGYYEEARKPLGISLRLGGGPEVAKHLAMAMTLTGDAERAKALLMQYFDLKEVYCDLGEAYELGGDISEAVRYYKLALMADKDYRRAKERLQHLLGGGS